MEFAPEEIALQDPQGNPLKAHNECNVWRAMMELTDFVDDYEEYANARPKKYSWLEDQTMILTVGEVLEAQKTAIRQAAVDGYIEISSDGWISLTAKGLKLAYGEMSNVPDNSISKIAPKTLPAGNGENTMLTDADLQDYMKVGERQHVRNTKYELLKAGDNPILTNIRAIKAFISDALTGKVRNTIKAYGKVGAKMTSDIIDRSNGKVDLTGYYLELDANRLNHLSDHVEEDNDPRNIPLTEEQALNITNYIDSYDDVLTVKTEKDGRVKVILGKKINGHAIIVELVSKGRKSIQPITAWQLETSAYRQKYLEKRIQMQLHPEQPRVRPSIVDIKHLYLSTVYPKPAKKATEII